MPGKSLKEQGVLALLGVGPDREQREHKHQPQLILSVPACLSRASSWSQGLQQNNLVHPCPEGVWVPASQRSPWKHSLSWEIWVLASSSSFCSSLQTWAGFSSALGFKQPEYLLGMTCTWLGTGGWFGGSQVTDGGRWASSTQPDLL